MNLLHGLLLCDDLIFASKIRATAAAHGCSIRAARTPEEFARLFAAHRPSGVILELDHSDFNLQALLAQLQPRPRIVAYGSHVDVKRLKEARQLGCHPVLPRSAFVDRLEAELRDWLAPVEIPADQTSG